MTSNLSKHECSDPTGHCSCYNRQGYGKCCSCGTTNPNPERAVIEGTLPSNECMHRRPEPSASPSHQGEYYCLDCGGYFLLSPVETTVTSFADRISARIEEMRSALYTFGTYGEPVGGPLLDGVQDAISELLGEKGAQEKSTKSYRPCGCEGEACKGHPENGKGD